MYEYKPGDRVIEGYGIVDVYDNTGELITTEDIAKQMDIFMDRGGVVMDLHTNRPSGQVVYWEVTKKDTDKGSKPSIYLKTVAFQGTPEDDEFWDRFNKYYKGFSVGGGKAAREYTGKGTILKFPLWEFSYVPKPANPEATIEKKFVAKSNELFSCNVTKSEVVTKPDWVQDDSTWEKAKNEAKDTYPDLKETENKFWSIVTEIYKRMGGEVKKNTDTFTDASNSVAKVAEQSSLCENSKDNFSPDKEEVNQMAEDNKPSEVSVLKEQMDGYDKRLQEVEKYCSTKKQEEDSKTKEEQDKLKSEEDKKKEEEMVEKVKKSVLETMEKAKKEAEANVKKSDKLDLPSNTQSNDYVSKLKELKLL